MESKKLTELKKKAVLLNLNQDEMNYLDIMLDSAYHIGRVDMFNEYKQEVLKARVKAGNIAHPESTIL